MNEVKEVEIVDALVPQEKGGALSVQKRFSVDDVIEQMGAIQETMKRAMKDGEDYGTIPGCGDKPSLLKPGAEKLLVLFRLAPRFTFTEIDLGNGHREVRTVCDLHHISTGEWFGQGAGSCSTLEAKYRWRLAKLKCPACGQETVIKGREEYGGGWLCYAKKGGCGAKWPDGDAAIEKQERGQVENRDIADQYNTVLKMSQKRALAAAVLTATGASAIFTQDVEDMAPFESNAPKAEAKPAPAPAPAATTKVSTESILGGKTTSATTKRGPAPAPARTAARQRLDEMECEHGVALQESCRECAAHQASG